MAPRVIQCGECEKVVPKLHRVHKGHGYCCTCYARNFKTRVCPRCGKPARLLKSDDKAVCRHCEKNQPCVRCGDKEYAIGRITPYGPVCNACSVYFRKEIRPCPRCGKPSRFLCRSIKLGFEQEVCQVCRRIDHGTCALCHKNRILLEDNVGRLVCRKCHEKGFVLCPCCGEEMPAGMGGRCENCYWRELLGKRIAMAAEIFSLSSHSALFGEFGEWLGNEIGVKKAAISLNRYLPFFQELFSLGATMPEYSALLVCFTTLGLRRNLLPMRFLGSTGKVMIDEESKRNAAAHGSIVKIIGKFEPGCRARKMLDLYHAVLVKRLQDGRIKQPSIPLALRPAASLLVATMANGHGLPTQKELVDYLQKSPGQRAALSGFVCFLRDQFQVALELPKALRMQDGPKQRKVLEKEMMGLMTAGAKGGEEHQRKLIEVALRYFHRVPLREARKMAIGDHLVKIDGGDMAVFSGKKHYWLPKSLVRFFDHPDDGGKFDKSK